MTSLGFKLQQYFHFLKKKGFYLCEMSIMTIPLTIKLNSVIWGFFLIHSLLNAKRSDYQKYIYTIPALLMIAFFALIAFNISDVNAALFNIEKSLSLVIIPLAIGVSRRSVYSMNLMILFAIGCVLLTVYLYFVNFLLFAKSGYIATYVWNDSSWIYMFFTKPGNIHPVYLSIYHVISFYALLLFSFSRWAILRSPIKVLLIISILISLATIFFIQSRLAVLTLFIVPILALPSWGLKTRYTQYIILGTIILISIGALLFFIVPTRYLDRLKELPGAISQRTELWQAAWNVFEQNKIWGTGTDECQYQLDLSYLKHGNDIAINHRYNTHNQYLHVLISHGFIGFMVFFLILVLGFYHAYTNERGYIFAPFLISYCLFFTTENVLSLQKGIVLFVAMYSLLIFDRKWSAR